MFVSGTCQVSAMFVSCWCPVSVMLVSCWCHVCVRYSGKCHVGVMLVS